jgi:hypothetical protein
MQTIYWVLSIIVLVPSLFVSLKWIAARTKTKKDDELISKVERIK